jgi:hypothetical protein
MPITADQVPARAVRLDQGVQQRNDPFHLLQKQEGMTNLNLGGKFALPAEFDTNKHAGGFYAEGQEALAMQARQPITGSPYTADGWVIWRYPAERDTGRFNEKNEPIMEKHPMAGQPHKVAGMKPNENFVLMFRPRELQDQINHVYGLVSIDLMTAEIKGESLAADAGGDDPGMIPDTRLKREIGAEREIEELQGRSTAVHSHVTPGAVIERRSQRVSR